MENKETLSEEFKNELDAILNQTTLNPNLRRRKLITWFIRTAISVVLYIIFWKYDWVKWTLILTVPLTMFSLFTIVGLPYLLKRKIEITNQKLREADQITEETTHDEE